MLTPPAPCTDPGCLGLRQGTCPLKQLQACGSQPPKCTSTAHRDQMPNPEAPGRLLPRGEVPTQVRGAVWCQYLAPPHTIRQASSQTQKPHCSYLVA